MKRDLVLAGKAVGGASLTGAVLYLVATVPTHVHVYWPYWLFLAAVLVGVGLYFAGQERSSATEEDDALPALAAKQAGPAAASRWQLTINKVSSEMLQLRNNSISHPGYMRRSSMDAPPPSIRIGMMVACAKLDASASTSTLRAKFLRFLGQPPVMDLLHELTATGKDGIWTARDDNPPFNFGAVFTSPDSEEPPVAWARVLLPESLTQQYGRDSRRAHLVMYAEPRTDAGTPAPAASLIRWQQRLSAALKLPPALAAFLADDLGLPTANDPAAEVGVWLKAPHALTELVEVDGFDAVAGSAQSNWFMGFAVASPDGEHVSETALAWLRQMCDSSLHLDDYEPALASLRPQKTDGPRLTVRLLYDEWDTWRDVAYIVALEVEVANATNSPIRIASIGLVSDWEGQIPGELPVIRVSEQDVLNAEVAALSKHRYAPEVPIHQDVPPQGSVTGWIVSTMPRSPLGATPRLTLTVREAVGRQYLLVIPRTDPYQAQWSDARVVAAMDNKNQLRQELGFLPLRDMYSGATFGGLVPWVVDHGTRVQFLEEETSSEPLSVTITVVSTVPQGSLILRIHNRGATLEVDDGTRTRATIILNTEEAAQAARALTEENLSDTPAPTVVYCGIQTRDVLRRRGTLTVIRERSGARMKIHDGTRTRATARLNAEEAGQAAKALTTNQAG